MGVLVICELVFTVFCIVCTVFLYCFVYIYIYSYLFCLYQCKDRGHAVGQLFEALRYKSVGRGFPTASLEIFH